MLSSRTQYALIILHEIHAHTTGDLPKLKTIGEKYKLSVHFLEQVARDLRVAKLIISRRGPGGGYTLGKDRINFLDVQRALNKKTHKEVSEVFAGEDIIQDIENKLALVTIIE